MGNLWKMLDPDPDVRLLLPDGSTRPVRDLWWPTTTLMVAGFLMVLSLFLPYWRMTLFAPQYPKGLTVSVYLDRLEGDVQEVDGLNHYLGMPSLNEGGRLERHISIVAVGCGAFFLLAAVFIHNRLAGLIALPAVLFPLIFLADLKYILYRYGHSIDPTSALGQAVQPFTPPLWGKGTVGQFSTYSEFGPGLYLAMAAAALVLLGLWLHRRAYKPIVEARRRALSAAEPEAPRLAVVR